MPEIFHATAIGIKGKGVVLIGASGCGKSDLALRLIDRGAILVSDDQVQLKAENDAPYLYQAPNIAGKIEVRGIGIIDMPPVDAVPLRLVVALDREVVRHPDGWPVEVIGGYSIPLCCIDPFAASAPIKVEMALALLINGNILPVAARAARVYED